MDMPNMDIILDLFGIIYIYLSTQWAAVRMWSLLIRVPPHSEVEPAFVARIRAYNIKEVE